MAKKKYYHPDPGDTYIKWTWETGYIILNLQYYFVHMPKADQKKLDNQMQSVGAKMTTIMLDNPKD